MGPRSPFSLAHASQIGVYWVRPSLILVEPLRNQSNSRKTPSNLTFFVVKRGNPWRKSYFAWVPKAEIVPVPVRSSRRSPFSRTYATKSRYCFITLCPCGHPVCHCITLAVWAKSVQLYIRNRAEIVSREDINTDPPARSATPGLGEMSIFSGSHCQSWRLNY